MISKLKKLFSFPKKKNPRMIMKFQKYFQIWIHFYQMKNFVIIWRKILMNSWKKHTNIMVKIMMLMVD